MLKPATFNIRPATTNDIKKIAEIYSYYVLNSIATFEEDPPSDAEMKLRLERIQKENLPFLVLEDEGEIQGYAYAYKYRERSAYRLTVEISIYVRHGSNSRGYGSFLMKELMPQIKDSGIKTVIAVVASPPSVSFHEKFNFRKVGVLEKVGLKFGGWIDTTLLQYDFF